MGIIKYEWFFVWRFILKNNLFNTGTGPSVPYANGLGQLEKAVSGKVGSSSEVNYAVSAINYGYADSGLFGAFVIADAGAAGKVYNILRGRRSSLVAHWCCECVQ